MIALRRSRRGSFGGPLLVRMGGGTGAPWAGAGASPLSASSSDWSSSSCALGVGALVGIKSVTSSASWFTSSGMVKYPSAASWRWAC